MGGDVRLECKNDGTGAGRDRKIRQDMASGELHVTHAQEPEMRSS